MATLLQPNTPCNTERPDLANGVVLWRGNSLLAAPGEYAPIVVVATGIRSASYNPKTGKMIQIWILPEDTAPHVAVRTGRDASVCGDCPLRGTVCYVTAFQAPLSVWKAYHRGNYPMATTGHLLAMGDQKLRIGAYGDPTAAPVSMWLNLLALTGSPWTGYTHQWQKPQFQAFRSFLMASVDDPNQLQHARDLGWRSFVVLPEGSELKIPGAKPCPSPRVTCAQCRACDGNARGLATDRTIHAHGNGASKLKIVGVAA